MIVGMSNGGSRKVVHSLREWTWRLAERIAHNLGYESRLRNLLARRRLKCTQRFGTRPPRLASTSETLVLRTCHEPALYRLAGGRHPAGCLFHVWPVAGPAVRPQSRAQNTRV